MRELEAALSEAIVPALRVPKDERDHFIGKYVMTRLRAETPASVALPSEATTLPSSDEERVALSTVLNELAEHLTRTLNAARGDPLAMARALMTRSVPIVPAWWRTPEVESLLSSRKAIVANSKSVRAAASPKMRTTTSSAIGDAASGGLPTWWSAASLHGAGLVAPPPPDEPVRLPPTRTYASATGDAPTGGLPSWWRANMGG